MDKKRIIEVGIVWLILIALAGTYFYLEPTITGFITRDEYVNYSDSLSLVLNDSGEYEWNLENLGELASLKVSGSLENKGYVKVYIENDDKKHLVFDSSQLEEKDILDRITGLVVAEGNESENKEPEWISNIGSFIVNESLEIDLDGYYNDEDKDELSYNFDIIDNLEISINDSILTVNNENDIAGNRTLTLYASDNIVSKAKDVVLILLNTTTISETINETVNETVNETIGLNETINETANTTITINLEYKAGTDYDIDDNGIETTTGVIDFSVESTMFGWEADESRLCTVWETYSEENEESTIVCYGSSDCCSLLNIAPTRESWEEVFYSYYGQYGATLNNVIHAQVYYYDYDNGEIYSSRKVNLSARYYYGAIKFGDVCIETCALAGFNSTSYKLVFEINGTVLYLDSVDYLVKEEVDVINNRPVLIKNVSNITIGKNQNYIIDLSEYFYDADGDRLSYSYYETDNISVVIEDGNAVIIPDRGFVGKRYMFFKANDSESTEVSNVFKIDVVEGLITGAIDETRVVINRPVKWVKKIKLDEPGKAVVNITTGAENITVKKIEDGIGVEIEKDKIRVNESGKVKNLVKYEEEKKKIKKADKQLPGEKGIAPITGSVISITGLALGKENISDTNPTALIIDETVEEIEIEYYTEGPVADEKNISENKKQIVISSDIHYENILAYTFLEREAAADAVKLYWLVNNSRQEVNADKYDLDYNGLVDYIEWNVPSLSNQTYEVEIRVLNVQSYPTVGGNWEVRFNTTGTGNLSIRAIEGTSYSEEADDVESSEDDLTLLELRCGEEVLEPYYLVEIDEGGNLITGYVTGLSDGKVLRENEDIGKGFAAITGGVVEDVKGIGGGVVLASDKLWKKSKDIGSLVSAKVQGGMDSLISVSGNVINNVDVMGKLDIETTQVIIDGRELSKEEIKKLRVSINRTKLTDELTEKWLSGKTQVESKENIEESKSGLLEITGNFIKDLTGKEEETIQIDTSKIIIDGRELSKEEVEGLKKKSDIVKLDSGLTGKVPINEKTDNKATIKNIDLKNDEIIRFFEIMPSVYAEDGYRTVVIDGKEYALVTKTELEWHSYIVAGFYYENYNCTSIGHHTVKVLTPGVHTQLFGFNGQNATANNMAYFNESGYKLKLNIQTDAGGAQENESGYNISLGVSPDISGFVLNETGYKVTGNVYTDGFGGYYDESGYKLFLVPKEAFYSHLCSITPNDPSCLITVITNLPEDNSYINSPIFNCSAVTTNSLVNITLYGNWSLGWHANETKNLTGISNSTTFAKNLTDGEYVWNCLGYDQISSDWYGDWSGNFTFTVDATYPKITYAGGTEEDGTYQSRNWIYVNVTVTETNFDNITFYLYNETDIINITDYATQIYNINYTSLTGLNYYYNVTVRDKAGNINSTETRQIGLDTKYPVTTLNYPVNSNNSINFSNVVFNCSATDEGFNLANISLYSDYKGGWQSIETTTITGSSNSTTFARDIWVDRRINNSLVNNSYFIDSRFEWNCLVFDLTSHSTWAESNYKFSSWSFNSSYYNTTTDNANVTLTANSTGGYPNTSGEYHSKIFYAGSLVNFNNLSWGNRTIVNSTLVTNISIQTRTSDDGSSWTAWSENHTNPSNSINPSTRYLQYKAMLTTNDSSYTPYLNWVNISYTDFSDLPIVSLNSPSTSYEQTPVCSEDVIAAIFNCSATDHEGSLANMTLYGSWNGWHANETKNLTGASNSTTFTKSLGVGAYVWNCLARDTSGGSRWSSQNFTLRVKSNESCYKLKLNIVDDSGGAQDTESGYKIKLVASPDIAGFNLNETGYKITGTIYTEGVGGYYNESGYKLHLVPEQAFYSQLCAITPNDPACPPIITNVSASPSPQGYGLNVTIQATVTGEESAWVEIITPENLANNFTMSNPAGDIYQYTYRNYTNGTYSYKIFANDDLGNEVNSSTSTFDIYVNMTIQVRTLKDSYDVNEWVNLTDPPEFAIDISNRSKVQNNGTTNASVYILMKVQYYNSSTNSWIDDGIVYNSTAGFQINTTSQAGNMIKLDKLFKGKWNTSDNASNGDGTYRVFAALTDNEANTLVNVDGAILNDTYNFTIDTTNPVINGSLSESTSSIYQNQVINASFNVTDVNALSSGQVIINDTGYWRYFNFSLSGTEDKFNQNFTVSCPTGCVVNVTGFVQDINGYSAINDTLFTVVVGDTCSCPSSGDWAIDCADNCAISSDCDMQGNSVSVSGDGSLTMNAKIYNFEMFAAHDSTCKVVCRTADGCFG